MDCVIQLQSPVMEQVEERKIATMRERLKESVVQQMIDAAQLVMFQKGYESATMQDIATAAGCAAGTFYLHFKNKESLFNAILVRHGRAMFSLVRQNVLTTDDPLEKVRRGIEAQLLYIKKHKDFFRLFFEVNPFRRMERRIQGEARELHAQYQAAELSFLRKAQQRGQIRHDIPAEVLQGFLESACLNLMDDYLQPESPMNLEELINTFWGLLLGGLKGSVNDAK